MANIDAQAGLARARTHATNTPGTCLGFVYAAYGSVQSIGPHAGQYPVAINGWLYSTQQHAGDTNPPVGVPIYFGVSPTRTDKNKAAGDVGISMGGGLGFFTDAAANGRTGIMTIAARAKQTARPYLGWTSDFLGHQLVNIGPVVGGGSVPTGGGVASGDIVSVSSIQAALNVWGYDLAVDGKKGPKTIAAIKDFQAKHGLTADGIVGAKTWPVLSGGNGLKVDGVLGPNTYKAMQRAIGVAADGIWGPASKKALQRHLGVTADGVVGPNTIKALQRHVGVAADGVWGPNTTRAIQSALNAGRF